MFIQLTPTKTYATAGNAQAAVIKRVDEATRQDVTWFIAQHTDGRFFPVFVGEKAIQRMLHFHFNIIG